MARRVFFSFHYQPDVFRANVVKNAWVGRDREDAGFFNASVVEATKKTSDDALRAFLRKGLEGASVLCALAGTETASRRWVRFEVLQALRDGRGIMEIAIHGIKCAKTGMTAAAGPSVLGELGFWTGDGRVTFMEIGPDRQWRRNDDVPSIAVGDFHWSVQDKQGVNLSSMFKRHDWVLGDGHTNLGSWVEAAAKQAGY